MGVGDDSEGNRNREEKGFEKDYGAVPVTLRDRRICDKIVGEEVWNWEMERGKEKRRVRWNKKEEEGKRGSECE